jgi:hypothetical protein
MTKVSVKILIYKFKDLFLVDPWDSFLFFLFPVAKLLIIADYGLTTYYLNCSKHITRLDRQHQ